MPRAGWVKPQDDQRLSDHVALGLLTRTFPPQLVDAVVAAAGREQQRSRLLPARLVVYYVLAMALFSQAGYEEVMRNLVEGLSWESGWRRKWTVPSKSAIFQARARLGAAPLEALVERGTHAMFAAAMGPYGVGDPTLARQLVAAVGPQTLVLADRGFTAHPLFSAFAGTGADLLWRAKGNAVLPVLERFADGSYRSEIVATDDKRVRANVTPVRVVEYRVDDAGRPQATDTRYRLLTTILDPAAAPADELAALYAERWEIETALDELKTHQRGARVVLRSKTPDGVRQEAWGYLCTHYAIRALMATAAGDRNVDADRVSFTRALHAARRSVRAGLGTATQVFAVALPATIAEICRELLPARRLRAAARVVKRK